MRGAALLACLALLLSGCSGGGDGGGDVPAGTATSSASAPPPPPPVPTTDTLHLLEGPAMTTQPPTGSDLRTPVGFANGGPDGNQAQGARWSRQVARPANVTAAEAHVWVEVKETLVDSPPNPPTAPPCFWRLTLAVGGDTQPVTSCVNEPPGPVNPGVKELVFSLAFDGPIGLEANETVTLTLARTGFSLSPSNAVDALSGSPEHDSRLTLRGLAEPMVA